MIPSNFIDAWVKTFTLSGSDPAIRTTTAVGGTPVTGILRAGELNTIAKKLFLDNGDGTFSLRVQ